LRRADHSSKESYRLCKKDYRVEAEARAQQKSVEPLMNEVVVVAAAAAVLFGVVVAIFSCIYMYFFY
jgi:hypothetical protein